MNTYVDSFVISEFQDLARSSVICSMFTLSQLKEHTLLICYLYPYVKDRTSLVYSLYILLGFISIIFWFVSVCFVSLCLGPCCLGPCFLGPCFLGPCFLGPCYFDQGLLSSYSLIHSFIRALWYYMKLYSLLYMSYNSKWELSS